MVQVNEEPLRILQVSTVQMTGGAARIAWNLHQMYKERGLRSWMAVGRKETTDPDVFEIPNEQAHPSCARALLRTSRGLQTLERHVPGTSLLRKLLIGAADPMRYLDIYRGLEDFHFPGIWRILDLTPEKPDIIHCHNLHGAYFDLRALPWLSQQAPVVMTLHDAWLLSGHCAHSFDCERWKDGCGDCPDLTIYPAIRRDMTASNWQRKRDIMLKSHLYVSTPSRWLMRKVEESIVMLGAAGSRVIPNGVDCDLFHQGDQQNARRSVGLPSEASIMLFASHGVRQNPWRDYELLEETLRRLSRLENLDLPLVLVCLGEDGEPRQLAHAQLRFVPFETNPEMVGLYYQAADVYLHPSRADTFPNVVLEALACGTPVVATAVGGIPEQIDDGVTGFLVPPGDSEAMAARVAQLLRDANMRRRLGENAADHARQRFSLDSQVDAYLEWYNVATESWKHQQPATLPLNEGR